MTISPDVPARPSVRPGRPSWRVAVASEADRLEAQLDAAVSADARYPGLAPGLLPAGGPAGTLPGGPASEAPVPGPAATILSAIQQARAIATGNPERRLRDWWFGTSIESAWQALHLAAEQLVMVQPEEDLRALAPHLESLARGTFGPDRARAEEQAVSQWNADPVARPDPRVAQRILQAYHASSDAQHQQIRGLRNLMYILVSAVVAIDCALWASGVTTGTIVGLGALAGALSVVFALRAGIPPGPYNVLPVQSMLKVASGAATALMAVKILDYVSGAPASAVRDSMYAVVFGFSQQAFTRLVDQQAGTLSRGPSARSGMSAGPLPAPAAATGRPNIG